MSEAAAGPIDTRDMLAVHRALERAIGAGPAELDAIAEGDVAAAARYSAYLGEVLWLLHAHHEGEDELLYPTLAERRPDDAPLWAQMDAEHNEIAGALAQAEAASAAFGASASRADGDALARALVALNAAASRHLRNEEDAVLPIAAVTLSQTEWAALPQHALRGYSGERIWLPLGLVLEAMPEDLRAHLMTVLPPPIVELMEGPGGAAYGELMAAVRV